MVEFKFKSWVTAPHSTLKSTQSSFAAGYPASKVGLKGC